MACSRRQCAKAASAGSLYCRCGSAFCSEACFVAAWHAGHKQECPHAAAVLSEVSEAAASPSPARRRASQTALLCGVALSRQKPNVPSLAESYVGHNDVTDLPCRADWAHPDSCTKAGASALAGAAAEVERPTMSTAAGSSPQMSYAGSTTTADSPPSQGLSGVVPERAAPGSYSLGDFVGVGGDIGSGAFGTVRKVVHRKTEDVFAMKIIPKRKVVDHNMTTHLLREVRTQLLVDHPHIIRLFNYFEDSESISLLLEYASGGSLFKMFQRRGRIPEREAVHIFVGIAGALDYLHKQNIIHRDVKPENILLCEGGVAKLADFGWCAELASDGHRQTFCGTWDYLSPEMVIGEAHDHAVDIWAMGVLLYEMLLGRPPFTGKNNAASLKRIQDVDLQVPPEVSPAARDLISRLLVRAPSERMALAEAQRHSWVKQNTASLEESSREAVAASTPAAARLETRPLGLEAPVVPRLPGVAPREAPREVPASPPARPAAAPAAAASPEPASGGLRWPWAEKLHRLELAEEEEEEPPRPAPAAASRGTPSPAALPPAGAEARSVSPVVSRMRCSPASGTPGHTPDHGPGVPTPRTLLDPERRHRAWKETDTFVAVQAFVKQDVLSMSMRTPRRHLTEDPGPAPRSAGTPAPRLQRAGTALSQVEEVEDDTPVVRRLEATMPAFFRKHDSPKMPSQLGFTDEADLWRHANDVDSQLLDSTSSRVRLAEVVL